VDLEEVLCLGAVVEPEMPPQLAISN